MLIFKIRCKFTIKNLNTQDFCEKKHDIHLKICIYARFVVPLHSEINRKW